MLRGGIIIDFKQICTRKMLIKERDCNLIINSGIQPKEFIKKDKEVYFKMKKGTNEI